MQFLLRDEDIAEPSWRVHLHVLEGRPSLCLPLRQRDHLLLAQPFLKDEPRAAANRPSLQARRAVWVLQPVPESSQSQHNPTGQEFRALSSIHGWLDAQASSDDRDVSSKADQNTFRFEILGDHEWFQDSGNRASTRAALQIVQSRSDSQVALWGTCHYCLQVRSNPSIQVCAQGVGLQGLDLIVQRGRSKSREVRWSTLLL